MPYRCPDGVSVWEKEGISLGLGYMRTLPEDIIQPAVIGDENYRIVADARLDNRADLCAMLDIPTLPPISETEIILTAYKAWGQRCVERFIGDFAFIIYDAKAHSLFAARDHLGIRPLFFRFCERGIVVATEVKVLINPGAPFTALTFQDVNLGQLANFICHRPNQDHVAAYNDIRRIPAGHCLTYMLGSAPVVESYWDQEVHCNTVGKSSNALALQRLLIEAVRCRLRSVPPPAILVSGGLDSSSIAACANKISAELSLGPIETFSIVFDKTPQESERRFVEAVTNHGNYKSRYLSLDDYAPLSGITEMLMNQGRVMNAPTMMMSHQLQLHMAKNGFRIFLDGHGGDEVISHGNERLAELAKEHRWGELWRELRPPDDDPPFDRLRHFYLYLLSFGRFRGIRLLRRITSWVISKRVQQPVSELGPALSNLKNVDDAAPQAAPLNHLQMLQVPYMQEANEMLELAAAIAGTQPCFPFFDKRVVEFCTSLPAVEKRRNGWSRFILREAMEGLLPREVQWRNNKFDFAGHLSRGMLKHHARLIEEIVKDDIDGVSAFVNVDIAGSVFARAKKNPSTLTGSALLSLWRTVCLSLWLRQTRPKLKSDD
jgi:asparagine synthase (glutamine-hydrolysing)